jgi:hypothetical protein
MPRRNGGLRSTRPIGAFGFEGRAQASPVPSFGPRMVRTGCGRRRVAELVGAARRVQNLKTMALRLLVPPIKQACVSIA